MQTKQIHIKATCENENRRFCISEAKFETLKQMISNLFSTESGREFTVKYKDDENDLVTISSDDELAFAVNLFPTDILRIVIDFSKPKSDSAFDSVCAEPKWHKRCKYPIDDEKRCHFLNAKRERILACLKELEGADVQANPKLLWKQEHLKRKLQKLDSKIANKDSASCGENKHSDWKGPSDERRCHFLAAKKERILARLKELEGADLQANPGLQWKKAHLEHKLQFIEAKLANKEAPGNCHQRFGGRGYHGHHGPHHGPHGPMGPHHGHHYGPHHGPHGPHGHHGGFRSGPWHQGHPGQMGHPGWAMKADKRCHFLAAKKERIEACLKEMEGVDLQANPGLFWKKEHLQRKLQKIENRLAYSKTHASNVPAEVGTQAPALSNVSQVPEMKPEEIRRIRETLKNDKQQAVAQWKLKKEAFQTVKRLAGDRKEELATLHEELMKAKEEAFQKKRALCEFKAKARASREENI